MKDKLPSVLRGPVCDLSEDLLHRAFEEILEKNPELEGKTALINGDEERAQVTFGDLNRRANALARVLLDRVGRPDGPGGRDVIVALRFMPNVELVTTIVALAKAGIAYVPIAPNWPEGRIRYILEDSRPVLILTNVKADILFRATKPMTDVIDICQYMDLIHEADATHRDSSNLDEKESLNNHLKRERLYAVLYTSGSTGTPKGVRLLHRSAMNRLIWQYQRFPYRDDDVCMFKTTLTFVDSVSEIWGPLMKGVRSVILPKKSTQNVERFVEALEEFGITRIFAVTSLIRSVLAFIDMEKNKVAPIKRLKKVRQWECSAEVVTSDLLRQFFDTFKNQAEPKTICNFYGSTEMSDSTYEAFESWEDAQEKMHLDKVPIGSPILNSVAYVLDPEMRPVPHGEIGELYIASMNLGAGYVGTKAGGFMENELDSNPNLKVLYKTGDYARVINGKLFYEGRCDSQIKIRGHRVDLSEIDKAVSSISKVDKAVVLCYKTGEPAQKVLCYFTSSRKCYHERKLEEDLKTNLPDYMMPTFFKLPSMPLLVNGKIDRQTLLSKYEESLKSSFEFSDDDLAGFVPAEKYEAARRVLETVAKILGCSKQHKPSLADDFFSIGGDSLNMVQVISRLNDYGYFIGITDFALSNNMADITMNLGSEQLTDDLKSVIKKMEESCEYTSEEMKPEHEEIVIDMISRSFAEKGDLTTLANVNYGHLYEQVKILWTALLEAKLSLVIKDNEGRILGACLNFDARSEAAAPLCARGAASRALPDEQVFGRNVFNAQPEDAEVVLEAVEAPPMSVVDFLEAVEEPLKEQHLPEGNGHTIYTSLLGTAADMSPVENVKVTLFLEMENIRWGKKRGYKGIFTTNSNRLTQHISRVLDYQILSSIQINLYEDENGCRPFADAPDDLVTEIALKWF